MYSVTNSRGFVNQKEQFEDREMKGEDIAAYKIIEHGDFAYNPARINVGSIARYDGENQCMISSLYVCFKANQQLVDSKLLLHVLKTPKMVYYYGINGEGGVRIYLFYPNFSRIRLSLPELNEQQKLSRFLDLIDERISIQNKVIEDLKKLKSAINDKLHEKYGHGIKVSFSEIGESYSGLSGKNSSDFGSGYHYIPYTNIFNNDTIDENDMGAVQIKAGEKQHMVSYGDALFTLSSETPDEVGMGSVYLGHEPNLYLNSFSFGIHITRKDIIYSPYISCLVSSTYFRKFVFPFAQGSTRFNLQKQDFEREPFFVPYYDRQIQIASFLGSISRKIEYESSILSGLTSQKSWLLLKLFI